MSVFQVLRLFSPGRCSVFLKGADWTEFSARAGDSALPGLLHLHCRVICTSTVFWSCQIKTVYFHSQLDLELLFRDREMARTQMQGNLVFNNKIKTKMNKNHPEGEKQAGRQAGRELFAQST